MRTLTALLLLFLAWYFFYPAPVRTLPVQPTEIEKREIRAAIKRYGNFMIVEEGGRRTMHTSYGKVRL